MSKILDEKLARKSDKEQKLWALRHTAEHVLHCAMQNLYPKLKKAMGPATDEGFYHDFDLNQKVTENDFPKIEKEMQLLIKADLKMEQEIINPKQAREIFKNNPYKLEWVDDIENRGEKVSIYKMGNEDTDLCSGPHLKSTGEIKAFKLLSVAGAYWHGDEKNKMLQRVYGTAFPTQKELDEFLRLREEAEKRDHRKLGKDLDLFVFSDLVGKGLPLLTPKGTVIRKELEKFVYEEETKRGYQHVVTPPLARVDLYKKSGHFPYYKDTMYPVMNIDEEELILRPMTCPHHFMLYKSRPHSYKELPVRYAEISPQFRYEKSGELSGLTRVRMFCLADAHIMCAKEQAKDEIKKVLDLIDYANDIFGLKKGVDYRYRLSLGDRSDDKKYYKDDKAWDEAEDVLREVLQELKAPFYEAKGEAAFYGPKIDIQMKKVSGQEETAFTVQYDFVMPKRFELSHIDDKGKDQEVVVVHRSSIGAFERIMALLIEFYAGAFPLWLAPVQAVVMPLGEKHIEAGQKIVDQLKTESIRAELWIEETVSKRIRNAELQKIPYICVIGDREIQSESVALRERGKGDTGAIKIDVFIKRLLQEIQEKKRA
jgi:threonyl-tRNA synthetase